MRHLLSPITTTTGMPSSSATFPPPSGSHKPKKHPPANPNPTCKHSPSATLDILVLILVLFSGAFLLTSSASYLVTSALLLLPTIDLAALLQDPPLPHAVALFVALATLSLAIAFWCRCRTSRCSKQGCKGLKKAVEFDLQLQTEECLRSAVNREMIDKLPWEGGTEDNPDYEPLRSEMRKIAPPNGRAVLLFRAKCGCPMAKLEVWGTKRGRRHKKGLALKGV
uniref:Ribosomal protein L34e superfamily protein n=1 Tax=Kalanchoe fedtschenkoi TaxID=63787 RepID=A0A7N1A0M6_KALFE